MQIEQVFNKILVPVDGSDSSLAAQELTAFIAKKYKPQVTAIHVVSHELMSAQLQRYFSEREEFVPVGIAGGQAPFKLKATRHADASMPEKEVSEITNWFHQKGKEALANSVGFFEEEGIPVDQKLIEHADPADTIMNEAEKGNYNLIAMGHSGENEQDPHLGRVAKKVSLHARNPVLIAKGKSQISRILVPVDGSENAERALRYAISLSRSTDAQMTLLHVQEPNLLKFRAEHKEIGKRILAHAAAQAYGIKPIQKLKAGNPARTIIQTAKKGHYDLIVMGAKGHSAIGRFLLGSVSDNIIHYADRSTLLIK